MLKRLFSRIPTLAVAACSVFTPHALCAKEVLLETDFADGSLGLWRSLSEASDRDWFASDRDGLTFAESNGFGANEASDDWLVSPAIDFDASTGEVLMFDSIRGFSGPDIEVLVSTDYDGGTTPSSATWTPLAATLSQGDFTQTASGEIDLSSIEGTGYIAFRYKADGTGAGQAALWRVTTIKLVGAAEGDSFPQIVPTDPPTVLVTEGDIEVRNGGYGSGMAKHPQLDDVYYLLTDRGPNLDGPNSGEKIFPTPGFNPQIGRFRLVDGQLVKEDVIHLKNALGQEITGLPNQIGLGDTGETPLMLDGTGAGRDFDGLDSEGLVALPDGTFWVSDEYGPHLVHFNVDGTTLERINPFSVGRAIPRVLGNRRPNRGMEGLTITPDRRKLVGIMQSSLDNPMEDRAAIRKNSRVTRIVVFDLVTGESEEYVYLQEKAALSNSEIRAISDTKFVVLERDGAFPEGPGTAIKRFYEIDLAGATNVTDPANHYLGMMVNGKTLEQLTDEEFTDSGIVPVSKKIVLDLLTAAPNYPHDKPEGFEMLDDGVFAIIRHKANLGWTEHSKVVWVANFSPDGERLVTGGSDGIARVWHARTGALQFKLPHRGWNWRAEFSPDASQILTTGMNDGVAVWNATTGEQQFLVQGEGHRHASFRPIRDEDGHYAFVAAPYGSRSAQVYHADTGLPIGPPLSHRGQGSQHYRILNNHRAMWSADGERIVTATDDGSARVWSWRAGKLLAELTGLHHAYLESALFSPDGEQIVTASSDGTAGIWNAYTGALIHALKHGEQVVTYAEFSPDGKRILTASLDGTARIWDAQTGVSTGLTLRHRDLVRIARFSPDGSRVLTVSFDETARIWDTETGHALSNPLRHEGFVWWGSFSPDGRRVVTGGADNTARLWDVPPAPKGPVPDWVPDWAEAVAGLRVEGHDTLTPVPLKQRQQMKPLILDLPDDDFYAKIAKWFYQDKTSRLINPFSEITVSDWVENRIKEDTVDSLQEAIRVSPDHPVALANLARALMKSPHREAPGNLLRVRNLLKRAITLDPEKKEWTARLARIEKEIEQGN